MPLVDFNAFLAQKYAIMQQQANADTSRANAGLITAKSGANLDDARAFGLPQQNLANIAQTQAPPPARSRPTNTLATIGLQRRQGQYYGANAGFVGSQANQLDILNRQSPFELYLQQLKAGSGLTTGGL
jgi:hypothetical protein